MTNGGEHVIDGFERRRMHRTVSLALLYRICIRVPIGMSHTVSSYLETHMRNESHIRCRNVRFAVKFSPLSVARHLTHPHPIQQACQTVRIRNGQLRAHSTMITANE